jgi:cytochrome c-type biogenesis protein CcmE
VKSKLLIAAVVIVVVGIAIYAMIPVTMAANPHHLKNKQNYFVYGTVQSDLSVNDMSVFLLNDSGSMIAVEYNGTVPAVNSTVLVHGEFLNVTFFGMSYGGIIVANGVYNWYLSA